MMPPGTILSVFCEVGVGVRPASQRTNTRDPIFYTGDLLSGQKMAIHSDQVIQRRFIFVLDLKIAITTINYYHVTVMLSPNPPTE
jgi:hypothetical protein